MIMHMLKSFWILRRIRRKKKAERQKLSFPKESAGNADFYKPVLNKIMTTQE